GRAVPATDRGLVGDGGADDGAGRLLAGVDGRGGLADDHRLEGGAAGDRGVVAVAVVGRHPVVGARRRRRVARRGGRAAGERLGVGEQRRAGPARVVVEVERHGPGRVLPAADRGLVGDRAAHGGAGRLLAGVDRRGGRGDGHRLGGGDAGDRGVIAIAVVGGDPVVGARRRRRVARRGGRAAGERLGVGEQRRAGPARVVVEVE